MRTANHTNDLGALLSDMIDATQRTITANWSGLKPFVESESRHILESIRLIAGLKEKGSITEEQAALHMEIQLETYKSLLLTVQGIRKVQAENAVNAGLGVIRDTVNRLLGWALL